MRCLIIGSYGSVKRDDVAIKEGSKPGDDTFLPGITQDMENIQDYICNDPNKQINRVYTDVPGAERPCSQYLSIIEMFMKTCKRKDCGGK